MTLENELRALAIEDVAKCLAHGSDMNPFSTPSARQMWQLGWDGKWPGSLMYASPNWRIWRRGVEARRVTS